MAGIDEWVGMHDYCEANFDLFAAVVPLPNGVPSHDTFGRVMSRLNPKTFHHCFVEFTNTLKKPCKEVIAIDGKTARASANPENGKEALHAVSAWATQNRLVLGQVAVDSKSNEITALPELLAMLDLEGQIVTMDAMGCQRKIAAQIIEQKGDYILGLKGNQGTLHTDIKLLFEGLIHLCGQFSVDCKRIVCRVLLLGHSWRYALVTNHDIRPFSSDRNSDRKGEQGLFEGWKKTAWNGFNGTKHEEYDKGHGRIECRKCWASSDLNELSSIGKWPGLKSAILIESERTIKGKTTVEQRFYISSLEANAGQLSQAIGAHWEIENKLHWVLDLTFNEDASRIYKDNGPEIMTQARKLGLNLINQARGKLSVRRMQNKMKMSAEFLFRLVSQGN